MFLPAVAEAQGRRGVPQLVRIRVRGGETVRLLAERYNVTAEAIARLNGVEEDAPLQPGMEVLMPSASTAPVAGARRAPTAQAFGNALRARAALYEPHIRAAAARHGVDPRVLWTIAFLETRFQPNQISPKGARGLMQFMPGTAATYNLTDPFDPASAIDAAARYVRDLSRRFSNRLDLVLAGYNAGEGSVEAYMRGVSLRLPDGRVINPRGARTGGVPPYTETRNYVAHGIAVARGITSAGVFTRADMMAGASTLTLPSAPGAGNMTTTGAALTSNAEVAQSAPAFVTPASSYASGAAAASTTTTNEPNARPESEANTQTPGASGTRSFRASSSADAGGSSLRVASSSYPPRARSDAPAAAQPQPRSTRVAVGAQRR
jgi:hypothetical protein